jgi:hypothetical protein
MTPRPAGPLQQGPVASYSPPPFPSAAGPAVDDAAMAAVGSANWIDAGPHL